MQNILFYKYVEIEDLNKLKEELFKACEKRKLKGKILLAHEGINGNLTGEKEQCENFIQEVLQKDARFKDMQIKKGSTSKHNFKRLLIKKREEIITSKLKVNLENTGEYLEPEELKELLDNKEELLLVDARNEYEYEVGSFEGAINPRIDVFTEFPKLAKELEENKNKTIVTFCTGGVRCEKASAYLKEQGFEKVYQLHGGIIRYGEEVGDAHWRGKCFVFDERGAIEIDPQKQKEPESQCVVCYIPEPEQEITCKHCNKKVSMCIKCVPLLEACCSKFCRNEERKTKESLKSQERTKIEA